MDRATIGNGGSDQISHFIKRRPAVNFHHATRYSKAIGLPLNRFVTINFALTTCGSHRASHAFRKLLTQRFAPWLRRSGEASRSIPPTYVWALECGGGQTAVHWLVHIPKSMRSSFDRRLTEWLSSLLGAPPESNALHVKPIRNLIGLRWYLLKGVDPAWAPHLGVKHVDQGITIGKRSGFSKNLGPAARKRGGYRPRRMPPPNRKGT